jgi:hypothetical protein
MDPDPGGPKTCGSCRSGSCSGSGSPPPADPDPAPDPDPQHCSSCLESAEDFFHCLKVIYSDRLHFLKKFFLDLEQERTKTTKRNEEMF